MALVTELRRKQAPRRTSRGQARFAFTILFIINILNYADRYVLPAILPKIQHDLALNNTESGLLGSSFLLVYALATLPIGIWADRGIRKNIVAFCVGIWSVATMLAGFTQNFIQLFSVRAVLGIGEAGYGPASLSLLGDLFPKTNRGRILSYWSAGTLIGAAIGVTLGGLVANALGWRWAFYLVGIPGLIMAFLAWRLAEPERGAFDHEDDVILEAGVPEEEEDVPVTHGSLGTGSWETIKKLGRIPTYWTLVVALVFSFFTIGGTSFWLPTYFVDTFKLNVAAAGVISGGVLVSTGLVGTVVGGWLADAVQRHHPEGRLFVAMLGFLLGAPLVLIALFLHSLPMFLAFFVLAGITLNFCTGPLNAVIQDVITPSMRATALGLALLLAHLLGDAAAPTIIGALADKITLATAMIVTAPTFLFIAGFICLLGLRYVARDMQRMEKELHAQRG
jgi:MFS transporter, Spinster family, sphingosine-1-phosphate transporter